MAHFAQLDENNVVLQVIVVHNNDCLDENGNESEAVGVAFCQSLLDGNWKQTSYNGNMRKNYAGIGYTWDGTGFAAPQPFPSWSMNQESYLWEAPVPYPNDNKRYSWDEATTSWVELETV